MMRRAVASCGIVLCLLVQAAIGQGPRSDKREFQRGEWRAYGHDPGGTRYSTLDQINRSNVSKLKVAWTYRTGDYNDGKKTRSATTWQHTPLFVDGTMYIATPFNCFFDVTATTDTYTFSLHAAVAPTATSH